MEDWFFRLSALVAISSFLGFIVLSVVGTFIEKRIKDRKAYEKAGRISTLIAFTLFLMLGFSMVPVMVGLFFPNLQKVVPIDISALQKNDMLFVFGAWAVYLIGIAIAWPYVKKDFFEAPLVPEGEAAGTAPGAGTAGTRPPAPGQSRPAAGGGSAPGLTWPPLEHQIKEAGAIVLASTEMDGGKAAYTVLEIWKSPGKGFKLKVGMTAPFSTKFFELQGYTPLERQLVVFFITKRPPYEEVMELLPVIGAYVMYAPSDTSVQEYVALGELKERVLRIIKQA